MESKALKPTPGQIQSIQDSPKLQEQVSRILCEHCDAERSGLDEALKNINAQFRVLSIPLGKISQCGSFLVRAGESGYVFQTRWRHGYRYHEGLQCPRCLGVSSGSDKQQYKSNQCLSFASETVRVRSKSLGHGTLVPNL